MTSANVHEFTDANFDREVLQSAQPVLVDFWAEWCMPCKLLGPVIEAVAAEIGAKAKIGKVDTDSSKQVAMKYQITAIPTIIIFRGGQPVKKFVGLTKKEALVAALADAGAK